MNSDAFQLPPLLVLPIDPLKRIELLFGIYVRDLVETRSTVSSIPVVINRKTLYDGREDMFWHLIQVHQKRGNDGVFDYERAIRLPWIKRFIDCAGETEDIISFDHESKPNVIRRYIWHEEENYRIILEKTGSRPLSVEYILVTAHYLDWIHERKQMEEKYCQRI